MSEYTLGDFGASGARSAAGDELIDKRVLATEVAAGEWEYEIHTPDVIAWHIPESGSTLQLWADDPGWVLKRGNRRVGSRQDTLAEGFELAREYTREHPGGERR